MISPFFLMVMMGMSLCSSLILPSELPEEPNRRFARFVEADDYPALGSETINGDQSPEQTNTTGEFVRVKRQRNAIGGHSSSAGRGAKGVSTVTNILDHILKMPGKCCPSATNVVDGIGNWCVDGTQGTPYCAYGGCNISGCNCDGGCRTPPADSVVAIMYTTRNFGKGLFHTGSDKAFTVDSRTCINFGFYNDNISGIIPTNGCVKVWEHTSCEGASKCVCEPISSLQGHEMRHGTSWESQISSMSQC